MSRWSVAGPSEYWLLASSPASKVQKQQCTHSTTNTHKKTTPTQDNLKLRRTKAETCHSKQHNAQGKKIRRTQHNSSDWASALADSWATKAPSAKMLCKQTICFSLHFRNNITCFSVVYWWSVKLLLSPVQLWIMADCCFRSNICAIYIALALPMEMHPFARNG